MSQKVAMEEEKGYEEVGTEPLLQGECAGMENNYTKNIPVQK